MLLVLASVSDGLLGIRWSGLVVCKHQGHMRLSPSALIHPAVPAAAEEAASTIWARVTSRCSVRPARVTRVSSRRCEPVKVIRSVLLGDILAFHDEFPLVTPASPVTGWMLVNDTPIR